jgi:hypothetical protein
MSAVTVAAFPRSLSGNPYCDLLYRGVASRGTRIVDGAELSLAWVLQHRRDVQVLHLHWPELYYRGRGGRVTPRSAAGFVAVLAAARLCGYRIVWTVHNALPHERRSRADRALRWVLYRTARLVVHAESARRELAGAGRTAAVVPHGHYIGAYPHDVDEATARARLGLAAGERVFLCFGQLRAYKGIPSCSPRFARSVVPTCASSFAGSRSTARSPTWSRRRPRATRASSRTSRTSTTPTCSTTSRRPIGSCSRIATC